MGFKNVLKKALRICGYDLSRYCPSRTPAAQLSSALKLANVDIVLDIGANEGQFSTEIREHGYRGEIVSFEPLTSAREKLLLLAEQDKNWTVHKQCAIGDHEGVIEINVAGNSVSSSVLPMLESHASAAIGSAYIASEQVPISRLDSLANLYLKPDSKVFIKIDTQGYEWQVINGASETLKRSQGALCELSLIPLYEGQRLWRDIIDRMETEGFMLWGLQRGFTHPLTGQSLQTDGVFLRHEISREIYPPTGAL